MTIIRPYTLFPVALEGPRSDSSPHQWTSTVRAIKASFPQRPDVRSFENRCALTAYGGCWGESADRPPSEGAAPLRHREAGPRCAGRDHRAGVEGYVRSIA